MTVYSYISTMPSVKDTIEGIEFLAGVFKEYTSDQLVLNKYVPARLDRYVDGIKSNSNLIIPGQVYAQELYDVGAALGLSIQETETFKDIVSGSGVLWANRPDPTAAPGGLINVTDIGGPTGTLFRSDGIKWYPLSGRITIANLPGPYSDNTGTNKLIGFSGGAPKIPAGLIVPGSAGTKLRITAEVKKLGSLSTLAGDIRFGTANSFADSQLSNLAPLGPSAGATASAIIDITFPTSTTIEATQRTIIGSGSNPSTGYYPAASITTGINTTSDMYVNIGYNTATAGDGLQVRNVLVELFQ
jgi:hypothetical protein